MTEIVFNSGDYATLLSEAKTLGFVDEDDNIITNGTFESGGGWFLNIVGTIYDVETPRLGYWGRLRLNGTPAEMPTFSSAIVQYGYSQEAEGWVDLADGSPAPDWVATTGVIA